MDHGIEETNRIQNMLNEWIINNEIGETTKTAGFGNKLNSKSASRLSPHIRPPVAGFRLPLVFRHRPPLHQLQIGAGSPERIDGTRSSDMDVIGGVF
jgi:hypothetical protein